MTNAKRTCDVEGCERPFFSKGLCNTHYARKRRYGDPTAGPPMRIVGDDKKRFLKKVTEGPKPEYVEGRCWGWTGVIHHTGYAMFKIDGQNIGAHRWSYETFVGSIPDGFQIDHLCRNRSCVNPDHLEPVTQAENVRRGLRGELLTHCPRGHPYEGDNLIHTARQRYCRACRDMKYRERRARNG